MKIRGVKLYRKIILGENSYLGTKDKNIRDVEYIFDLFPKEYFKGKRVLDIGCAGGGISFRAASEAQYVVGIDILRKRIKAADKIKSKHNINNIEFLCDNIHTYMDKILNIDCVFLLNVLHHEKDPIGLLHMLNDKCSGLCIEHPIDSYFSKRKGYDPATTANALKFDEISDYLKNKGWILHKESVSNSPHVHGERKVGIFLKNGL